MKVNFERMILPRIVAAAVFVTVSVGCFGQSANEERAPHNVFLEFFGPANIIGVSYDTRFPGSQVWGWRAGAGFSDAPLDGALDYQPGISVPLGVNGIFGKWASKFEVGAFIAPGLYFHQDTDFYCYCDGDACYDGSARLGPVKCRPGCSLGLNLGYRLQRRGGFAFRIGWSPSIFVNSGGAYLNLYSLFPHIGFGYTFR